MEITEGIDVLSAIIRDKNYSKFLRLDIKWFNSEKEELRLYNFINKFYTRYSKFPDFETCKRYNVVTSTPIEPYEFYLDSLYTRYLYIQSKKFIKSHEEISNKIRDLILGTCDPKELELCITQFCSDNLLAFQNKKEEISVTTFSDELINFKYLQNRNKFSTSSYGILTPYDKINESTHGLKMSEWLLITGAAKRGKSFLWINFIYHAWLLSGNPTLISSLEMDSMDEFATTGIFPRLISMISGVNLSMIRSGKLPTNLLNIIDKTMKKYEDAYIFENKNIPPLYFLNGRKNKNLASFKTAIRDFNPVVVGIDSIYLAEPSDKGYYRNDLEREKRLVDERMELVQSTRTIGIDTHQLGKTAIKEKELDIDNIAGVAAWVRNPDLVIALESYHSNNKDDKNNHEDKRYITRLAGRNSESYFRFPIHFKFKPSFDMSEITYDELSSIDDYKSDDDDDHKEIFNLAS